MSASDRYWATSTLEALALAVPESIVVAFASNPLLFCPFSLASPAAEAQERWDPRLQAWPPTDLVFMLNLGFVLAWGSECCARCVKTETRFHYKPHGDQRLESLAA